MRKREIFLILTLFLTTSFFRFYNIDKLSVFTYDQARDALYTKRIIVDHKLRLLGPQSSPGFYTGPAYYYLMAPFLMGANLNPSGMDIGVAVFNTLTVLLLYLLLKKISNNSAISFIFAFLYSIQPQVVLQSRFSWNPNLTPFFSILFIYGFIMVLEKKTIGWLLSIVSMGILIQLHLASVSIVPTALLFIYYQRKKKVFDYWFLLSLMSFVLTISPFILVELRHDFTNIRYLFKYLSQGPAANLPASPIFQGLWERVKFLFSQLPFGVNNDIFSAIVVLIVLICFIYSLKSEKQREIRLLVFSPIFFLIMMSLIYRSSFFQYYLTFLYPFSFIVLCAIFVFYSKRKITYLILLLFIPVVFLNIKSDFNIIKKVTSNISNLRLVSSVIAKDEGTNKKFNVVGIRGNDRYDNNGVDYRYYLETFDKKRALDWDVLDYQNSEALYVISTVGEIDPLATNIWEISLFEPKKVAQKWDLDDNTIIYNLLK